jgi:hypothetical protein
MQILLLKYIHFFCHIVIGSETISSTSPTYFLFAIQHKFVARVGMMAGGVSWTGNKGPLPIRHLLHTCQETLPKNQH